MLSNANLRISSQGKKISISQKSSPREMPQIKVTKRKEENKKMAKIIEIL
jgi:hypothetical protein